MPIYRTPLVQWDAMPPKQKKAMYWSSYAGWSYYRKKLVSFSEFRQLAEKQGIKVTISRWMTRTCFMEIVIAKQTRVVHVVIQILYLSNESCLTCLLLMYYRWIFTHTRTICFNHLEFLLNLLNSTYIFKKVSKCFQLTFTKSSEMAQLLAKIDFLL